MGRIKNENNYAQIQFSKYEKNIKYIIWQFICCFINPLNQ